MRLAMRMVRYMASRIAGHLPACEDRVRLSLTCAFPLCKPPATSTEEHGWKHDRYEPHTEGFRLPRPPMVPVRDPDTKPGQQEHRRDEAGETDKERDAICKCQGQEDNSGQPADPKPGSKRLQRLRLPGSLHVPRLFRQIAKNPAEAAQPGKDALPGHRRRAGRVGPLDRSLRQRWLRSHGLMDQWRR